VRTEKEIEGMIKVIESTYDHVLTGSLATIHVNAPRALMQSSAEAKLQALYWTLGRQYKSKLNGTNT
jgi:hypothetical protein